MKKPAATPIEDGWEIWRCTACNAVLCVVKPSPGLILENECRKCGKKDVRQIFPDIDERLAQLESSILRQVREMLG